MKERYKKKKIITYLKYKNYNIIILKSFCCIENFYKYLSVLIRLK